jgi:hypothetical protein
MRNIQHAVRVKKENAQLKKKFHEKIANQLTVSKACDLNRVQKLVFQ